MFETFGVLGQFVYPVVLGSQIGDGQLSLFGGYREGGIVVKM